MSFNGPLKQVLIPINVIDLCYILGGSSNTKSQTDLSHVILLPSIFEPV